MPIRVVRIVNSIETFWIYRIFYVQQNSNARARTRRKPERRINGDIVALIGRLRLSFIRVRATIVEAVDSAGFAVRRREL
jgi:hypothetical protein